MKSWVPEFLRLVGDSHISPEQLDRELQVPLFCQRRLLNLFSYNFSENQKLIDIVASVLGDVNAGTFFDLLTQQRLFFVEFHDFGCAFNILPSEKATAVILLDPMDGLPFSVGRGIVVHELLGHVRCGHHREKTRRKEFEEEADVSAIAEGFGDDILSLREFKQKGGLNDGEI